MNYKICTTCKIEKEATLENFHTSKNGKYGLYPKCRMCRNNKYKSKQEKVIENRIKYLIKLDSLGFDVNSISEEITNNEKTIIICKRGHSSNTSIFSATRTKGCARCITLKPYFEISNILKNEGYNVLSKEEDFNGSAKTKIDYICPNGHFSSSVCSSVRRGNRCVICSHDILSSIHRADINDIIKIVEDSGYDYKGVIGEYKNSKNRIYTVCPKGHDYKPTILSFTQGVRCNECFNDTIRGKNHYLWNGLSPLYNHLRSTIYKWKVDSFIQSNRTCFITGISNSNNIIVHHHKNFSDIVKETVLELDIAVFETAGEYDYNTLRNIEELCLKKHYEYGLGVVMLEQAHILFHKIYSKYNNTMEQVLEFKKDYENGKYPELLNL